MNLPLASCARQRYFHGLAVVIGVLGVLLLIAVAVVSHPKSVQGAGSRPLWLDVMLLVAYGAAAGWVCYRSSPRVHAALSVGARVGLVLGAVLVANHVIELFVPVRPFLVVISPVLFMMGLLGGAGSAAWERTRAFGLAIVAGVWSAIVAVLIALCAVFCLNFVFKGNAELSLREAFAAGGMNNPDAFLVRNMLEAASEGLIRLPVFALFLSFAGAVANAWISTSLGTALTRSSLRRPLIAVGLAPMMFVAGAAALWHADSLVRSARPPFVMSGVVLVSLALCSAHAVWSALRTHAEPLKRSL